MKTISLIWLGVLLISGPASGQTIELRVSVHVILNPTNGLRPTGVTDALFRTAEANANEWMARYHRGYRLHVTEITNVGGPSQGGFSGPSKWFGQDFHGYPQPWLTFQNETQNDSRYRLRSDAVNFYVATAVTSDGGGACPIPPGEANLLACQGFVNTGAFWLVHETGHFFGLNHTFGGEQYLDGSGQPCTNGCICAQWVPGDDGVSDTLPDHNCWITEDALALGNYGQPYASLVPSRQTNVVSLLFNVMSYHNAATKDSVENIMTELQLDLHADTASTESSSGGRFAFSSGKTYFISAGGSDGGSGRSTSPYRTVGQGVTNSAAGDILLLRPGNYNQRLTINRPVTLRAARAGWATVGQ